MKTTRNVMTLRLDPQLDELLTEASYDRHTTKTDWIRSAIRASLGLETPLPELLRRNNAEETQERRR
ncbi:MAG: hypothetical protein LC114_05895 [Bryobacterales bacterium]|nr:hypothetical protein [Bryobacterales bacterium]